MPSWASSKHPARRSTAPVNAPFSWPKISLSRSVSGMAAQLMATNGPRARGESSCSVRATSSFPVPLSPVISTGAGVGAASSTRRYTSCIALLVPTSLPTPHTCRTRRRRSVTSRTASAFSAALGMSILSRATSTGFVRKSYAPSFMAATAVSMLPCPVRRMTAAKGNSSCRALRRASPSRRGMMRSVITTEGRAVRARSRASSPSAASSTA